MLAVFLGPIGEAFNYTVENTFGYNLFSGDISDIEGAGVFVGVLIGLWKQRQHIIDWKKRHECHVKGCDRIIWKIVPGTDHEVCKFHHPHEELTHEEILQEHQNYKDEKLT